jgi:hypothetical protein
MERDFNANCRLPIGCTLSGSPRRHPMNSVTMLEWGSFTQTVTVFKSFFHRLQSGSERVALLASWTNGSLNSYTTAIT